MANTFVPITSLPILPGTPGVAEWLPIQAAGITYRVEARSFPLVTDSLLTWGGQQPSLPGSRQLIAGAGIQFNDNSVTLEIESLVSGQVDSIVAGTGIDVDSTDPVNPVVSVDESYPFEWAADHQWEDGFKAIFGDDDDLSISHDGTNGHVENVTGDLIFDIGAFTAALRLASSDGNIHAFYGEVIGDPGTEDTGIMLNGTLIDSVLKTSDLGWGNLAQFILHRHSTGFGPWLVGARSHSDDETHAIVEDGDDLLGLLAVGWDGAGTYRVSSAIEHRVDGTPGVTDMPGMVVISTVPSGANQTLMERVRVRADGSVEFVDLFAFQADGSLGLGVTPTYGSAGDVLISGGAGNPVTWAAGGGGGSIDSVNAGVGITVDSSTPADPIVNLDVRVDTTAASGTTLTLDIDDGPCFDVTLDDDCTISLDNPYAAGNLCQVTIILRQGGAGGHTVTWFNAPRWSLGQVPVLSAGAGAIDVIQLITIDEGTTWMGGQVMADVS